MPNFRMRQGDSVIVVVIVVFNILYRIGGRYNEVTLCISRNYCLAYLYLI